MPEQHKTNPRGVPLAGNSRNALVRWRHANGRSQGWLVAQVKRRLPRKIFFDASILSRIENGGIAHPNPVIIDAICAATDGELTPADLGYSTERSYVLS